MELIYSNCTYPMSVGAGVCIFVRVYILYNSASQSGGTPHKGDLTFLRGDWKLRSVIAENEEYIFWIEKLTSNGAS